MAQVYNAGVAIRQALSLAAILTFALPAADWLNFRGDPQLSGWQKREKIISPANVGSLKLIWKLKLSADLQTPVILGHWVTHRGTKELIFAVSGAGTVYAVDGDLGLLFWQRQLDSAHDECGGLGVISAPVLAPGPANAEDDDDDVRQAVRPVYVLGANGSLYRLHPTTGADFAPPLPFMAPGTRGLLLYEDAGRIYGTTAKCGGGRGPVLSIDLKNPAKPEIASGARNPGEAAWKDGWTFHPTPAGIEAVEGATRKWTSPAMALPSAPVVANGVVYTLSRVSGSSTVLYALDALTGKQLYSSGTLVESQVVASGLAVANGHICFGAKDGTLYCFGFPVDL